jgi:solute carrier family 34 (sodium-dependent phosphate cotransporter)
MTVMVQSSSITTSVMIPLVAAGVVTLEHVFPFTIGANLGTTVTALIAALSTGSTGGGDGRLRAPAVQHQRYAPRLRAAADAAHSARARARARAHGRAQPAVAVLYVLVVFFVVPFLMIFLSGAW